MLKYITLFFLSFMSIAFIYGQKKLMCPIKDGYILKSNFDSLSATGKLIEPDPIITICGKKSEVYAMDSGIVRYMINNEKEHLIVLQTQDYLISLSLIDTFFIKKNDKIKRGQIIGRVDESKIYVMVCKKNGVPCEANRLVDCKEQ